MTKRVCRMHGCPRIQDAKLCDEHARSHEKRRGTRQQRGYDAAHDKERRRIEKQGIENHRCARCGAWFERGEPFQLGHTDDRLNWSGPEHIRCNTSAAGAASHAVFKRPEGRR
ncbi:hypothetical protein FJV46_10630 [Arthrobacter agilis]|uniref:hypothetical protein n=1 Tax=Arthrobacter agilis TaxID=37921 RepID=UPI000F6D2677|nr:hypothetical protein [Arthrobacter agilis]TPV23800.1 hypothetical protein FJV46_10630 [Arthrobacter agilis]VDR32532.1 Uncharacterised protein [Arthrobacter agilis]